MRKLAEFFPDTTHGRAFRSRVLNTLWMVLRPGEMMASRPVDWEPEVGAVSALRLDHIYELGAKGRGIINQWLSQREEAP